MLYVTHRQDGSIAFRLLCGVLPLDEQAVALATPETGDLLAAVNALIHLSLHLADHPLLGSGTCGDAFFFCGEPTLERAPDFHFERLTSLTSSCR
jgi:hypothetical protein